MNLNLDFGFFNWGLIQSFILKGLIFSFQLTIVAMIGGIALGTILALMRLSGKPWLVNPAAAYVNTLRSIPLVMVILWFFLLIPSSFYQAIPYGLGSKYRSEIAALTMFAMQAQEETSRGVEIYLAVTLLYFVSAFAVNRIAALIERRVQVPGLLGAK